MAQNLIYQYWDGDVRASCRAGSEAMHEYAKQIGAKYIFEDNPRFLAWHFGISLGGYSPHYGALKPVFDKSFDEYDNVLFVDTDVFPVDNMEENIFDSFTGEIGICTEPEQPRIRHLSTGRITHDMDERWAAMVKEKYDTDVPRVEEGIEVFNTGMVLWSKSARKKARKLFQHPAHYVNNVRQARLDNFYICDQPYIHAMMFVHNFDVQRMDNNWNSYIQFMKVFDKNGEQVRYLNDWRTPESKFVHVQFAGADNLHGEELHRVVNLPRDKWDLVVGPEPFPKDCPEELK
jgi:hypothetical protein